MFEEWLQVVDVWQITSCDRAYRVLDPVIVDAQIAVRHRHDQVRPLLVQIAQGFAQCRLFRHERQMLCKPQSSIAQ